MPYASFTVDDFTGGLTENPTIGSPNKHERMENLMINDAGKPEGRYGSDLWSSGVNRTINGEATNKFVELDGTTFLCSGASLYQVETTPSITSILGPTGNQAFNLGASATNYYDTATWQDHIFITNDAFTNLNKVYNDGSDWQLRTAGLPALANDPTVTAGGAAANSYIYAFVYYYTYTVGTVVYEDFSATSQVQILSAAAPDASAVNISVIPVLANGTDTNYDTAEIDVRVYRTISGGKNFYLVGSVDNGTTIFADSVSDADLIDNEALYVNGGVLDNTAPLPAKYIEIINNIGYYGFVKEGLEEKGFRIMQSKPNDIDSVPGANFVDLDGDNTGITSISNIPIVFTKDKTYRLDGVFDVQGRGSIKATVINNSIGCVSNESIARGGDGVYFAGNTGLCWTDGRRVVKLTEDLNETYKEITSTDERARQISGAYDKINQLMYWAVQRDKRNDDNDSILVFHERYGIKQLGVFTPWSNGESFAPKTIYFDSSNDLVRGDTRGFFFKHKYEYRNDPRVELGVDPASWGKKTIIWDLVSSQLDAGYKGVRKWGAKLGVRCQNISNLSIQPQTANDGYENWFNMAMIRRRDQLTWEKTKYNIWETSTTPEWQNTQDIHEIRYFPQRTLRFFTKQVRLTNAFAIVQKSDDTLTTATDGTAKTLTIAGPAPDIWIDDCVEHWMFLEDDDYTLGWAITGRTDTVLTVADPRGDLPTGSGKKWVMKGYPKDERLSLVSYTVYFVPFSDNFKSFATADLGANSA